MLNKFIIALLVVSMATPAFGGNPSYSGHIMTGGRTGHVSGEAAVFAADFSGGSDPLGDFDLKLDTIVSISEKTENITMRATINPKVTSRFKKILQRYTLIPLHPRGGAVWIKTPEREHREFVRYEGGYNTWVYRTSVDGGVTWSPLKATPEVN